MKGLPVQNGEETVIIEEAEPQHIILLSRALKPGKQLMGSYHLFHSASPTGSHM